MTTISDDSIAKSNRPRTVTEVSSSLETAASTVEATTTTTTSATRTIDSDDADSIPQWFPRCCIGRPVLYGNREALGWLLGMMGQTLGILGIGTFVAPAIIYFAKLEAGCATEPLEGETKVPECHGTAYGLKPSSLVTTLASILSLCVAFLTPLMGAIVDYTRRRRLIGRVLACCYFCLILPHIFMSESTWFPLTILVLLLIANGSALTLILHAYLPELTDVEQELNDFTKTFTAAPGAMTIVFILVVIGTAAATGQSGEEGPTARIAAMIGAPIVGACLLASWGFLLQERPALNQLAQGRSLWTEGFKQIYRTSIRLKTTNLPLLWFYVAVAFGDVKPLTSMGLAFLSNHMQFSSMEIGLASILMLCSTIPGAAMSSFMCRRFNPIRSSVVAIVVMILVTFASAAFLVTPDQKLGTYFVVACWGIGGGWKVTSTVFLVAAIVPEGNDAELMGFYLFADICLSWAIPLMFTSFIEAGYSERIGIMSINIFFIISLGAYWKIGPYEAAAKAASRLVTPAEALVAISEVEDGDSSNLNLHGKHYSPSASASNGDQESNLQFRSILVGDLGPQSHPDNPQRLGTLLSQDEVPPNIDEEVP